MKVTHMRVQHYWSSKRRGHSATLQFRLTFLIVITVLAVLGAGIFVDYHFAYQRHVNATLASLEEQARALVVANSRITERVEFAGYVDDFCAQMNEHISPGHHILVLDATGKVIIRARHHSGAEVEKALLSSSPQDRILAIGEHRLAQVRLKEDGITIIIAQYLDHMERILRAQVVSRSVMAGITALAIILLLYLVIRIWVIRPVNNLAGAAREWAGRNFSVRSIPMGPADFRLLADEFNSMSKALERHERNRIAELEQARQIQSNLLPAKQPTVSGLHIATEYRPAQHVAGDLYDIFNLSNGRTCIAVLDVCGHGISAALLTGVVKMSLHRRLAEKDDLECAMKLVNDDLLACTPEGQFATACVGIWNQKDQSWTYCAAGHPGGLLLTRNNTESLESTAPLLGVLTGTDWPINVVRLSPGHRVFLYTDGVVEAGSTEGELEDYNLEKVLNDSSDLSLSEQVATIMAGTIRRSGGSIKDDATIVAFEVLPKPVL
jgi:HAMP domain-containing protein